MSLPLKSKPLVPDSPRMERIRDKLGQLERNISALLGSEMDNDHKRMVLAVLQDYKETLLERLKFGDRNFH